LPFTQSSIRSQALRDAGADLILAVDVSSSVDRVESFYYTYNWCKNLPSVKACSRWVSPDLLRFLGPIVPESVQIVGRSLTLSDRCVKSSSYLAPDIHHLFVKPAVDNIRWYEFHRAKECIQAGETAGIQIAEQVKAILQQKNQFAFHHFCG
jgi:NTE family protein